MMQHDICKPAIPASRSVLNNSNFSFCYKENHQDKYLDKTYNGKITYMSAISVWLDGPCCYATGHVIGASLLSDGVVEVSASDRQ